MPGKADILRLLISCAAVAGDLWQRRRKDVSLVNSRRAFRTSRRRRAAHGPGRRLALVAAGTGIPVLVAGYALLAPHSPKAVSTASVSYPAAADADAGGWARDGYEMTPGPAGPASSSWVPGAAANAANAGATSENWAGYTSAGAAGTFTSVSASWVQ